MGYNILITGASSGFGALMATALAKAGHNVYGGYRKLEGETNPDWTTIECDITSDESVKKAVETVGDLDILIHNAGHMSFGPLEAFSPEQLHSFYETNAVGAHRLQQAALPKMRAKGHGLIIWIGSTSTRGGTPPFLGPYFAAKAAMDSLAVTYAAELAPFGIETSIVLPGAFPTGTNHFANAGQPDNKKIADLYQGQERVEASMGEMVKGLKKEPRVEDVADEVVKLVAKPFGQRPFRIFIDPIDDGAERVSKVADEERVKYYQRGKLDDLLTPKKK